MSTADEPYTIALKSPYYGKESRMLAALAEHGIKVAKSKIDGSEFTLKTMHDYVMARRLGGLIIDGNSFMVANTMTTNSPLVKHALETTSFNLPDATDTKAYGCGNFGQYFSTDVNAPPKVLMKSDAQIVGVSCEDHETYFLMDTGTLRNSEKLIPFSERIISISSGPTFSAALTETNNVYIWGKMQHRPNGKLTTIFDYPTPTLIESLKTTYIVAVACGAAHMLVLTKEGVVLSYGSQSFSRLGRDGEGPQFLPVKGLLEGKVVKHIACGHQHNVVATENEVYSWGRNNYTQCGIYNMWNTDEVKVPTPVKEITGNVMQVVCGPRHVAVLSSLGVHVFGESFIQGHGIAHHPPRVVTFFEENYIRISKIATGIGQFIALTEQGEVYTWGRSDSEQCGFDIKSSLNTPHFLQMPYRVTAIAAGGHGSVFVTGLIMSSLESDIATSFDSKEHLADLKIEYYTPEEAESFLVHRAFLYARCPRLLLQLIQPKLQSACDLHIFQTSDREEYEILYGILKYLYTGLADYDKRLQMFPMANTYNIVPVINLLKGAKPDRDAMRQDLERLIPVPGALPEPFHDFTFVCGEERIPAIKYLMCLRSPYYKNLFDVDMLENKTSTSIVDESPEATRGLLAFLYTDVSPEDPNVAIDVMHMAHKMTMKRLQILCERNIEKEIDETSVLYVYKMAEFYQAHRLMSFCAEYAKSVNSGLKHTDYWKEYLTDEDRQKYAKLFGFQL